MIFDDMDFYRRDGVRSQNRLINFVPMSCGCVVQNESYPVAECGLAAWARNFALLVI